MLKKYSQIWEKVKTLLEIKFDSEPIYGDNDKHIKTKIKKYGGNVNTDFPDKGIPKEKASYKCLLILMLVKVKKKHYPKTLLEECKNETKKTKKMENFIDDELEASSSDDETDITTDDDDDDDDGDDDDDDETEFNDEKDNDEPNR